VYLAEVVYPVWRLFSRGEQFRPFSFSAYLASRDNRWHALANAYPLFFSRSFVFAGATPSGIYYRPSSVGGLLSFAQIIGIFSPTALSFGLLVLVMQGLRALVRALGDLLFLVLPTFFRFLACRRSTGLTRESRNPARHRDDRLFTRFDPFIQFSVCLPRVFASPAFSSPLVEPLSFDLDG